MGPSSPATTSDWWPGVCPGVGKIARTLRDLSRPVDDVERAVRQVSGGRLGKAGFRGRLEVRSLDPDRASPEDVVSPGVIGVEMAVDDGVDSAGRDAGRLECGDNGPPLEAIGGLVLRGEMRGDPGVKQQRDIRALDDVGDDHDPLAIEQGHAGLAEEVADEEGNDPGRHAPDASLVARRRLALARFPQSAIEHQRRRPALLVSRNSQPQRSPAHSRTRSRRGDVSKSAADDAIGQSTRSRAVAAEHSLDDLLSSRPGQLGVQRLKRRC